MDPLSKRTRLTYLYLFVFLFIVSVPITILYASGYRLASNFSVTSIGGIYVTVPVSDATLSLNGKEVGTSSLFKDSFYIDGLSEGTYAVHVSREGYYPWYKTLIVDRQLVTDVDAFMVPQTLQVTKLVRSAVASSTASTTRALASGVYDSYVRSFASTTIHVPVPDFTQATSTLADDLAGGVALYIENNRVRLHWTRSLASIPSSFCVRPQMCIVDLYATGAKEKVSHASFFAKGVVYQTPDGIFLTEVDVRPSSVTVPIYAKAGSDFRIIGGDLIVKDGTALYEISGF